MASGLTQTGLAAALGVTSQAVSAWERGIRAPDLAMAVRIARLLGTTVEDLWGEQEGEGEDGSGNG